MKKADGRIRIYTTDEGDTFKIQRWSVKKFYKLFELFGEVAETIGNAIEQHMPPKEKIGDSETITGIVKVAVCAATEAHSRVDFIISESLFEPPDSFEIDNLLPEDYLGLLAEIVEQNITERAVKNFRRLLTAFGTAAKMNRQTS